MAKFSNHLVHESSPYLLQHAHNPVDWYPWGEEALAKAKAEDKPILVSIGYAACHWCHVMERESFENEATAQIMNENFVNIKIDREERPDLDHIYMDAVQAMSGSGGWPLNVFLTPDGKPFYGGTYYPPQRAFNRESWPEVLAMITTAFKTRRHEVNAQAENLTDHLVRSNLFGQQEVSDLQKILVRETVDEAFENVMKNADTSWGGFGRAPKFPQVFTIQFLLRYFQANNKYGKINVHDLLKAANANDDQPLRGLQQALLSVDKMIEGGIYDQIGGGFARYSTDTEWLAPHFEKMLYDNALLVGVISEAYQLTGEEKYRRIIEETMQFIERELLHDKKAFYSALDADSEGVEGKFYVWDKTEVAVVLGDDAAIFCDYFDITEKGNWEEKNIPRVLLPFEQFASARNIDAVSLEEIIERGKSRLMAERSKRIRPQLDDKILLGWNALMNTACSKAYKATGKEAYRQLAITNMKFLIKEFRVAGSSALYHTWKNGKAKYPGFLDDYAYLVEALIHLQEITGDTSWLEEARQFAKHVIDNFSEEESGFFYYTAKDQKDVIVRKKEIYDGATPSGNAIMAYNLYRLSILYHGSDPGAAAWRERAIQMTAALTNVIAKYPTSFGVWLSLFQEIISGSFELVIIGKDCEKLRSELSRFFIPNSVLMSASSENQTFPLLAGKTSAGAALIYICKNQVCKPPVSSIERFIALINSENIAD